MKLTLEAPSPGTMGWELVSTALDYVDGAPAPAELVGDKVVVRQPRDLGRRIKQLAEKTEESARFFVSGNDSRYVIGRIASSIGLPPKPKPRDFVIKFGEVLEAKGPSMTVLSELYATPSLLNVNFYEYGRGYLVKPAEHLRPKERVSAGSIALGYLGALLCYAGGIRREERRVSFYFIPRRGMGIDLLKRITTMHNKLVRNDYSDTAILVYLVSLLFERGVTRTDATFGRLVLLQEGNRPTLISVSSLHTSGLISLMENVLSTLGEDKRGYVASSIKSFIESPMRARDKERGELMGVVEEVSSKLVAYASTRSPEALLSLVDTLDRLVVAAEGESDLARGLKRWGRDPQAELEKLARMFSSMAWG